MRRFLAALLCVMLIAPVMSTSQEISVLESDWLMLKASLRIANDSLTKQTQRIKALENELQELRKLPSDTESRTSDLERQLQQELTEAYREQQRLQTIIEEQGTQYAMLLESLNELNLEFDQQEADHLENLEDLGDKYQRTIKIQRIVIIVLATISVGAVGAIALYQAGQ